VNAFILSSQMHMDLCMHAYATMQQLLCHGSDCELILSLARTSCRLSFASRPPAGRRPTLSVAPLPNVVARHCSLKKSAQIHASSWRSRRCSVAQASSDHLRCCRPHPVCLWVALALSREGYPSQKCISAIFARVPSESCISLFLRRV